MLITIVGLLAAAFTSLSYVPQVKKALPGGSTDDLSSKTLAVLAAGLALWSCTESQRRSCDHRREYRRLSFGCHADRLQGSGRPVEVECHATDLSS